MTPQIGGTDSKVDPNMERIRSVLARATMVLILFAGLGLGLVATGFAVVLGAAVAMTAWLAAPRGTAPQEPAPGPEPLAAEARSKAAAA